MGYLTLKDFEGMDISSNERIDDLCAVVQIATIKYDEEKFKESQSSKRKRLIKEKALKKPMTMPMAGFKKQGFDGETIMAAAQVQSLKNDLKKIYESGEEDIEFKINKKSKYNNKESTSCRCKKGQKSNCPPLPNPPPDLPEEVNNRIKAVDGTEVVMVIQKHLTNTDLEQGKCRVSIPFGKINRDFLREREKDLLDQQISLEVPFYEPSHKVSKIILRQWDMGKGSGKSSSMYALRTHWNAVVKANGLKEKDVIQVWSFRVGDEQKLCLALVVVSRVRDLDGHGRSKMSDNEGASSSLGREKELACGGSM